jgi:peptidoglycan/xylan/chitin deacetylase (PgdA/CDA1 family)
MARLLPILYYHHVGVKREPFGHRRLWISSARFAEQMEFLASAGYRCVNLRDAPIIQGTRRDRQKIVVLTFDDGYDNFYQQAFPILSRHGFAATVFVVTGEIGAASHWDAGFETPLMNWRQIKEISRHGIEIASHTINHSRLTLLPPQEARRELLESRLELEEKLGVGTTSFAYPYGDNNSLVQTLAAETGYELACSIRRGNLHRMRDRFRLKRVPLDDFTSVSRLQRRLSPVYDFTCRFQRFGRTLRQLTAGTDDE